MSKRATGLVFVVIAALFYVSRFFIAANFIDIWDRDYYHRVLHQSGSELLTMALIAVVIGVAFFIWEDFLVIKQLTKKLLNWEEDV